MKRAAIALASAFLLVGACANGPESVGQPASGGAEDVATTSMCLGYRVSARRQRADRRAGQRRDQAHVAARRGLLGLATSGQMVSATSRPHRVSAWSAVVPGTSRR
jgi:hypothetical protein